MTGPATTVLETDVLVVGGGIAGLFAAMKARGRDPSLKVTLVDKGYPGASGCSVFAAGVLPHWQPGDELDNYIREIVVDNSEYLIDQEYAAIAVKESYDRFLDLRQLGIEFQKNERGELIRVPALSSKHGRCSPYKGGLQLTWKVRAEGARRGVSFLDRIFITDLLVRDGGCRGAVGFHTLSGDFLVFKARATIIAAGSIFYGRTQMGASGTTGDGAAIAFRAGVEMRNAEQVWATIGPARLASPGLHVIFGSGGRLINSRGERFMEHYNPLLLEEARRFELARAILHEWRQGKGPCFLDCRRLSADKITTIKTSLPLFAAGLKSLGLDLASDLIEFVPYGLSLLHTGGIRVKDASGEVGVAGLWVVGGAGDFCGGAESTAATTLAGSSVQGARAGEAAAAFVRNMTPRSCDSDGIEELRSAAYRALVPGKGSGTGADGIYKELCQLVLRYINLLKDEAMLQTAIAGVEKLKERAGTVSAGDIRELQKVHEVRNMLLVSEAVARCALLRRESRAAHYRTDFPRRDDTQWLKWTIARMRGNEIVTRAEDIPVSRWKYQPDANKNR